MTVKKTQAQKSRFRRIYRKNSRLGKRKWAIFQIYKKKNSITQGKTQDKKSNGLPKTRPKKLVEMRIWLTPIILYYEKSISLIFQGEVTIVMCQFYHGIKELRAISQVLPTKNCFLDTMDKCDIFSYAYYALCTFEVSRIVNLPGLTIYCTLLSFSE